MTHPSADDRFLEVIQDCDAAFTRIARVYGGSHGDEEDLYQEILVAVWRSLPSFRGNAKVSTWAYRVALNTGLRHRQRARRRPATTPVETDPVSRDLSDEDRHQRILLEFLDTLGEIDRAVLLLYMDGHDQSMIASLTGLSAGAVAVRIHRIKNAFTTRYVN